ncbi:unnamed protein product [Blepharisma stoltei]|uniref:Uncharacterized protein n=1 Tax=Blepharisma stoltei TaxID=1481888 RepID=A0AAU9JA80_9CILI|nr:unnamed protein product [Blepharisma stoltei]
MASIISVDEGCLIANLSISTPISQVFDIVSSRTSINRSLLIIFNTNGIVINENAPLSQQIPENSLANLYLFRKDKINLEICVERKDFSSFNRYPIDYYHEPFPFSEYDDFPSGYEKIPIIENSLFKLSQNAREFYAKYVVLLEYLNETKQMLEIRLEASDVLLKNLQLYYKEIKHQWKNLSSKALELQKNVTIMASQFNPNQLQRYGDPIDSLLQEGKFKRFNRDLQMRVNNFVTKVDDLNGSILKPIKENIRDASESIEKVKFTADTFFETYKSSGFESREGLFIEGLFACRLYMDFRDKLEKVVDVNHTPKRELANQLLMMENEVNSYNESLVQLQRCLNDVIPLEKDMQVNVKRIGQLYGVKVVRMIVESAHKLKYRVKDKLLKLNEKYENLLKQSEFLKVPSQLEEACAAAKREVRNSTMRSQNALNLYYQLCKTLIEDQTQREEFLERYGNVLPKNAFPELIQPVMKTNRLKHLLNIPENIDISQEFEFRSTQLNNEQIIAHYEAKLVKMEKNYQKKLDESKKQEERLEKDMVSLSHSLVKSSREKDALEKSIKDLSTELYLLKGKGNGDKIARNFQEEVRKLREREAAFKRMHMENLKALREENNKLKQELKGN